VQDSLVLLAAGAGLVQLLPLLVIFSLFFLLVFRPKSMTYALEPGGPKRLKISWSRTFKNIQILFDDQPLGSFPDKNAFKAGGRFPLPDGSALDLKFVEGLGYAQVQISRNGIPLPGTGGDPATQASQAANIVNAIGVLSFVAGLAAELAELDFLLAIGIGWGSVATGAVFLVLGRLVSKGSRLALLVAILLFSADTLFWFIQLAQTRSGGSHTSGPFVVKFFFILGMIRGFREMGRARRSAPAQGRLS
jgi:hypothetical protein